MFAAVIPVADIFRDRKNSTTGIGDGIDRIAVPKPGGISSPPGFIPVYGICCRKGIVKRTRVWTDMVHIQVYRCAFYIA
jgi:hypothetical protein